MLRSMQESFPLVCVGIYRSAIVKWYRNHCGNTSDSQSTRHPDSSVSATRPSTRVRHFDDRQAAVRKNRTRACFYLATATKRQISTSQVFRGRWEMRCCRNDRYSEVCGRGTVRQYVPSTCRKTIRSEPWRTPLRDYASFPRNNP